MNNQELYRYLEEYAKQHWVPIILHDSLDVLIETLNKYKPTRILEIGTAIGYSGLKILECLPDAHLTTIEIDEDRFIMARDSFKKANVLDRVTTILGDCTKEIRLMNKQFDFIFLDGPKGQYLDMFYYLDKVLAPCGIIFADNILFKGKAIGNSYPEHKHRTIINTLREFKDSMLSNGDYDTDFLPNGDGIIIAKKRRQIC